MPSSRFLIASNTLGSSAASVTFSGIPATYTDLVLKTSTRKDTAYIVTGSKVFLNSDTATNYSTTTLRSNGTSAESVGGSSSGIELINNASNATSNTFSNSELYLPNYNSTVNKPMSYAQAPEHNAATGFNNNFVHAHLYLNSTAISSITISANSGNFVSGSSFFLYGIKNS